MVKKKLNSELVEQLRISKEKVGALLPVLVSSKTGRIIDGAHRLHADKKWNVVKLDLDEKQSLIARLSINALRHPLERLDFCELGALLVGEGVKHGDVAHEIAKQTGINYNTVLRNLDDGFKKLSPKHLTKKMKKAIGKRFSEAAAEKRRQAEGEPEGESVADIESTTNSAESRVEQAVERHQNETAQSYSVLSTKDKSTLHFSLVAPLSALCDASSWIVDMSASEIAKNYQDLTADERIAVGKKLEYLQANVMKLAAAFKVE